MPMWSINLALAVCAGGALIAGIWLFLHLNAIAALFAGRAGIIPSGRRPRASRSMTIAMLILFNAGWIAAIAIWIFVLTGEANLVVNASV